MRSAPEPTPSVRFQAVLEDVAYRRTTDVGQEVSVDAYVRGAAKNQSTIALEGSTDCVTQRRYRCCWNRKVVSRIGKRYKRCLRLKAVFVAKGSVSQWVREEAAKQIRRACRSQFLPTLRLAGQLDLDPVGKKAGPGRSACE